MDEQDFREGLTDSEMQERAITIPVKVTDINLIERMIVASKELDKTFDQLACIALQHLFNDIDMVWRLRKTQS